MSGVVTGNGGGTRAAPKSASGTTLPLSGAASVACVRGGRGTTTANEKDPSFAGAAAAGGAANGGIEGVAAGAMGGSGCMAGGGNTLDRKSTRLNSSHRCMSYAVVCFKKKNTAAATARAEARPAEAAAG